MSSIDWLSSLAGLSTGWALRRHAWAEIVGPLFRRYGTGLSSRDTAAFSVCQARLAHFTRVGNSRTPANTESLPRSGAGVSATT